MRCSFFSLSTAIVIAVIQLMLQTRFRDLPELQGKVDVPTFFDLFPPDVAAVSRPWRLVKAAIRQATGSHAVVHRYGAPFSATRPQHSGRQHLDRTVGTLRPLFANSTLTIECRKYDDPQNRRLRPDRNMRTTALVDKNGSIDCPCLPRFDSGACFAALLGSPDNGHWRIAPVSAIRTTRRRYRGPTLILETNSLPTTERLL
jgi:hypothetical protein